MIDQLKKMTAPVCLMLCCALGICLAAANHINSQFSRVNGAEDADISSDDDLTQRKINDLLCFHSPYTIQTDMFQRGDTFSRLLNRHGFDNQEIHRAAAAMRSVHSPQKIRTGTEVNVFSREDSGRPEKIVIKIDSRRNIVLKRNLEDGWQAENKEIPATTSLKTASATIQNSLWLAATDAGIPPKIILDLADLFSWQIDFATDLRSNDTFIVMYTEDYFPNGTSEPGAIESAFFRNSGHDFYAFAFTGEDGIRSYYDLDGQSVQRTFLKSPLRYRYISSGYSRRRFHPVLKTYRPHLGIDYAAPAGTPVSALGDGIVVYRGWKGGYGKYVQIKHGDAYLTCYGHLSGYAKGIQKGARVRQGQVIGYVGSTGLSTGPHLDFRVKYRDQFINPLHVKSPPSEPVPDNLRSEFEIVKARWLEDMNRNKAALHGPGAGDPPV